MKTLVALLTTLATGWLIVNLVGALFVGAIARAVLPGKDKVGWFTTILVGFLGGMLGKIVAFLCGWRHLGIVGGFVVSVLGAIGLLLVHRMMRANKASGVRPAGG